MSRTEAFFGESQRLELLSLAKGAMVLFLGREGRALSGWRTRAQSVVLSVIRGVCVVSNSVQFADGVFQKSGQILMIV
jgi:hypothetical protein